MTDEVGRLSVVDMYVQMCLNVFRPASMNGIRAEQRLPALLLKLKVELPLP